MEKTFSEYFKALNSKAQSRYKQKLDMLGGIPDPYLIETGKAKAKSSNGVLGPALSILTTTTTPSPYTKDQLRAYKSLDAYNFATSGWVDKV